MLLTIFFLFSVPPAKPHGFELLESNSHSLVVKCDSPHTNGPVLPVTKYRVKVFPVGNPSDVTIRDFQGSGTKKDKQNLASGH